MAHSLASDSMHPAGKLPPTLTPTGHFAGKPTLPISRSVTLIGSRKQARLQLISSTVSQNHALIVNADTGPYIRDLASREHVFVNGIQVKEGQLQDGDEIQIGRFTFRFNASPHTQPIEAVREIRPAPIGKIEVDGSELPVPFEDKSVVIGRRDGCDIKLLESAASTTHAIIFEMDGRRYIRDLASRTGTFVNGKQIHQVELMPGDAIRCGQTEMRYVAEGAAAEEVFAPPTAAPADLEANVDDLVELDTAQSAATPAGADELELAQDEAAAGADELELVQDQAAAEALEPADINAPGLAIEPVEVTEVETGAEPAPAEAPADIAPESESKPESEPARRPEPAPAAREYGELPHDFDLHHEEVEPAVEHVSDEELLVELDALHTPPSAPEAAAPHAAAEDLHDLMDAETPAPRQESSKSFEEQEIDLGLELEPEAASAPMPRPPVARVTPPPAPPSLPAPVEEARASDAIEVAPEGRAGDEAELELEPVEPAERPAPYAQSLPPAPAVEEVPAAQGQQEQQGEELELEPLAAGAAAATSPAEPEVEEGLRDRIDVDAGTTGQTVAAEPSEVEVEVEQDALSATAERSSDDLGEPIHSSDMLEPVTAEIASEIPSEIAPPSPGEPIAVQEDDDGEIDVVAEPELAAPVPAEAESELEQPAAEVEKIQPAAEAEEAKRVAAAAAAPVPPPAPVEEAVVAEEPESEPAVTAAAPVAAEEEPEQLDFAAPEEETVEPTFAIGASAEAALPDFTAIEEEPIDFSGDAVTEAEALPADVFARIDESSLEVPSFDLGDESGIEPLPAFDDAAALEPITLPPEEPAAEPLTFEESAPPPPPAAASVETIAPLPAPAPEAGRIEAEPKKKARRSGGRKKKKADESIVPTAEAEPPAHGVAEAPEAALPDEQALELEAPAPPAEPLAPMPSRVAPPGASQLDLTPIADSELLAPTESTPESALSLDEAVAAEEPAPAAEAELGVQEVELTDSTFGRAVEDFTGPSTGPIVESPVEAPPEPAAEAPAAETEQEPSLSPAEPELEPQATAEPVALEPIETVERPQDESVPSAPAPQSVEESGAAAAVADEALEPPSVDEEAALDLLTTDQAAQQDSPALTLEEDRALAQGEPPPAPLLPVEDRELAPPPPPPAATPAGEETAAATAEADDRLFDELELEPLAAAERHDDPRYSVHPEDLDESAGVETIEATPVELEAADLDVIDVEESPAAAESSPQAPAVSAGQTQDTLAAEWDVAEEPPAAEPAARAESTAPPLDLEPPDLSDLAVPADEVEVELEPVADAPTLTPAPPPAAPPPLTPPPRQQQQQQAPVPTPAPAAPPTPPAHAPRRPAPIEAFNWGANQEHFFGGLPLQLDPVRPAPPTQQLPQQPGQRGPGSQPVPPMPPPMPPPQAPRAVPPQRPAASFPQRPGPQQPHPPRPGARATGPRPSPFAGGNAGGSGADRGAGGSRVATTGFEGFAIPTARDADVFGQVPGSLTAGFDPALMNDVFGGGAGAGGGGGGANHHAAGFGTGAAAAGRRPMPTPQPGNAGASAAAGGGQRRQPPVPPQPTARRATKAEPTGDAWSGSSGVLGRDPSKLAPPSPAPQTSPASEQQAAPPPQAPPQQQPQKKKRRWFGLRGLLVPFALVSMGATAAGVYSFLPVKSSVTGVMKFENFDALPEGRRAEFARPLEPLLRDENRTLRDAARRKLAALNASHPPGFLGDTVEYAKVISQRQFDVAKGTLSLPYVGGAGKADQDRMFALLQALYDRNKPLIDEAEQLNRTVESLTHKRAELDRQVEQMQQQIDALNATAAKRPDVTERQALEAEVARLQTASQAANRQVQELTSQLNELRANPTAAAGAAAAVNADQGAPPTNDELLQQLQGDLEKLNEQLTAVQEGRGDLAAAARQKLDAAVESFNKQLQEAQGAVRNNPELLAYLAQTQQTLKRTRDMTDQLIGRQQSQYAELSKVKQQLNQKMLARRDEVWKKDPELVNLMDQRDFKTRQYNTAVGQGLTKEAADLKLELSTLETEIAARQTLVADDGFYADAIDQLQKLADSMQRNLEADRAAVLQQLDEMQQEIARSQPPIDKLTPDQQQLAAEMEKRLADVSQARKQYAAAAAEANRSADDEVRTLQASASELASKVQARKQELAEATANEPAPVPVDPKVAIGEKERELAAAQAVSDAAESAYFAASKKLHGIKAMLDEARAAGEQRDALLRQRDITQKELDQVALQLDLNSRLAKQKAYPAIPSQADLTVYLDPSEQQRPVYALAAAGGVAALFVGLWFLSSSGASAAGGPETAPLPPVDAAEASAPWPTEQHDDVFAYQEEEQPQEHQRAAPVQV